MDNKIVYVKLKEGCEPLNHFENSFVSNGTSNNYYNIAEQTDISRLTAQLTLGEKYYLVALVHNKCEIKQVYLGYGIFNKTSKGYSFKLEIKTHRNHCISTQNICKLSELNLDSDFKDNEYIFVENSKLISEQIKFILQTPENGAKQSQNYEKLDSEQQLHRLAQRNEYCRRQYNLREPAKNRGEYQRDYERIVHSKAFRRMVDKAQVFSASKGDYYRTRMTHSQAVAQIARGIAEGLKLNLYLTEAIALGHDIGHTPFGHQGERTLHDILREKNGIIKNSELYKDNYFGGFKHNYQSLRVSSLLEEEYFEMYGMDLSFQTMEGMLKHTKLKRDELTLSQFTNEDCSEDLHYSEDICSTLEGQVVAIADEIAQRAHDLDDALSSGAMTYEELKNFLEIKKMKPITQILENVDSNIKKVKESGHKYYDENELRNSRTVSSVISYFINDVIDESKHLMNEYSDEEFISLGYSVNQCLICYSKEASDINKYLETIITSKVINSSEVSLFDSNAATIVRSLFKAYYNNPRLLHKGTLHRLYINLRLVSDNVIDFEYGNHELINKEFKLITAADLNKMDQSMKEEYKAKREILVRTICDFISGMTDTYATNEYNRIAKQL